MSKKVLPALLSILFFLGTFCMGAMANADAVPGGASTSQKSASASSKPPKTNPSKKTDNRAGGVVAKGMYSSGSTAKPYSPFATNLSGSPSRPPSMALEGSPSSFSSGWTSEVLTFTSNNLLNASNPADAQDPSVTPNAVISFLEGKGIAIATAAKTEIANEVERMLSTYDDRVGIVMGAPLARIFAIQIICMKNTRTGQVVYPEAFPQSMLGKDYSSQYQSSWDAATDGKTYTLDPHYIYDSISYTASNVIWNDPALVNYPWIIEWHGQADPYTSVFSLDQIESRHLSSMSAKPGKINSLNLIGITQRAYIIKSNPASLDFSKGYEESTGHEETADYEGTDKNPTPAQVSGGMPQGAIVGPGSSDQADFSVSSGPKSVSSLTATVALAGAPNATFSWNWNQTSGPDVEISGGTSDGGRALTLTFSGNIPANTTFGFEDDVDVARSSNANEAEVCAVSQGSSSGSGLTLKSQSSPWCFAVVPLSQKAPAPNALEAGQASYISMIVPGWAFQYNGKVEDTLWSSLDGKETTLNGYASFQPSLPKLDQYRVNADAVKVIDLATGANVTSLFSSSYAPMRSYDTDFPYSGAQGYGGWSLTAPSLSVSWKDTWAGSSVSDPGLWGYGSTPIGLDVFEITFPLTLESAAGGDIYSQSSTNGPASTYASSVYQISTPAPSAQPAPFTLTAAGIKEPDGSVESSSATATLGIPMEFEAEADFPSPSQISTMRSSSDSLVFYSSDASSNAQLDGAKVNGIALSRLPSASIQAKSGMAAILLTPQDLDIIAKRSPYPSKLSITYEWDVTSAPSRAVSEMGYVKGSSLSLSRSGLQFSSTPSALELTVNSNGVAGGIVPNASQGSAETGIWFYNQLLDGGTAKGSEFTVQNSSGQYLSTSGGNPPYSYSHTPYDFTSDGGGLFRIWGLANGTYTVTESKLPQGASGPLPSFKVTLDWASGKPASISDPDPSSLVDASSFMVFNEEGLSGLPLTGGKLKAALLCAAAALLALAGFAAYKAYKLRR